MQKLLAAIRWYSWPLFPFFGWGFFVCAKLQCHSSEKEGNTLEESTTQVERITSSRFSLLKHKGEAELKANLAVA